MKKSLLTGLLLALTLSGCTFVNLSAQGEKVRVLSAEEVKACHYLGKTTSTTTDKAAGVKRHPNAILYELQSLARNAAVKLGGDTVVADAPESDGKQVFSVYRCVPQ